MAEPRRLAIAVLAAGASRRFGEADKLTADFGGRPLGEHAVAAIPAELFAERWVITSDPDHACADFWREAGFGVIENHRASEGMGTSVALAANHARRNNCGGLMIALADMPSVPTAHFAALVDAMRSPSDIIASSNGSVLLPPAIFGTHHLDRLSHANGDEGARRWLADGSAIACPSHWLIDIDTPEALTQTLARHGQPANHTLKTDPRGD